VHFAHLLFGKHVSKQVLATALELGSIEDKLVPPAFDASRPSRPSGLVGAGETGDMKRRHPSIYGSAARIGVNSIERIANKLDITPLDPHPHRSRAGVLACDDTRWLLAKREARHPGQIVAGEVIAVPGACGERGLLGRGEGFRCAISARTAIVTAG
jgi:hypothetical protein